MDIDFEDLFEEKILKRGYNYYIEDAVHDVTKNGKLYVGLVYGTEIYEVRVEIDISGNVENMDCDCPYAYENNCKHMAALLYYIENDGYIENNRMIKKYENLDNIVDKISDSEIKEFVLQRLYDDKSFQNEFRSHFVQYFEKTPKEVYERRISQSIYQAIGRKGFIEYNETDKFSYPMYNYLQEPGNNNKTLSQVFLASNEWANYYGTYEGQYPVKFNVTNTNAKYSKDNGSTYKPITGTYTKPDQESVLLTTGATPRNSAKNIFDFAGNVLEWNLAYSGDSENPCVNRGGSYNNNGNNSAYNRNHNSETNYNNNTGFRLAL